jgi:hypothetical protein
MAATTATATAPLQDITIDELKRRSCAELESLYRELPAASSVRALEGKPKGEVLAVNKLDFNPVDNLLQSFASTPVFPWLGKGFSVDADKQGRGNNRLKLLGYKTEWFDFNTRIEPSVVDGQDAVLLDYDLASNPSPIRHIRDELREAAPGIWFGPAMARVGDQHYRVLWFAVDFNQ